MASQVDRVIIDYGFSVNEYDKCVYSKVMNNRYVILSLHVDDILIFGTKIEYIFIVKDDMKDLEESKYDAWNENF